MKENLLILPIFIGDFYVSCLVGRIIISLTDTLSAVHFPLPPDTTLT
jgi:hypothetical protein